MFVAVDTPPEAGFHVYVLPHGSTGAFTVPAPGFPGLQTFATDADNDPVTVAPVANEATALGGSVTINADGSFSYTPPAGVIPGPALGDTFTYKVNDGVLDSAPGTMEIRVTDFVPVAQDTNFNFFHVPIGTPVVHPGTGSTIFGPLPATDADPGDRLTYILVTPPTHGGLDLNSDGTFIYYAHAIHDGFQYKVFDGEAYSNVGTLHLEVQDAQPLIALALDQPNDVPHIDYSVDFDSTQINSIFDTAVDVAATDYQSVLTRPVVIDQFSPPAPVVDPDDATDVLHAILKTEPNYGMVTFRNDGSFVYKLTDTSILDPLFFPRGVDDSFTYVISDGYQESDIGRIDLRISVPTIFETQDSDKDGVPDSTEESGPNKGDGNFDGIPDSQQGNVATLPDLHGKYVTLATDASSLIGVKTIRNPHPSDSPDHVVGAMIFPFGFFEYKLEGLRPGGSATVTMYVNGTLPSAYFKYGYTPDNRSLHWYNFAYAGTTGAQFIPSNQAGVPNQVVLHFVDGQRGDDDLAINGSIDEPGAPAVRIFATPATAFVTSSYELVLEREPTSDELRYWTHRLAQGVPRLRVMRNLEIDRAPSDRSRSVVPDFPAPTA